jgi:hypothetical protein
MKPPPTLREAFMTLLRRWQGRPADGEPANVRITPAAEPPRRRMAGEYAALHVYLDARYAEKVVLTFVDIEALLGFPLPDAARVSGEWWTPAPGAGQGTRYADAWRLAHRTAQPNLLARTVAFEREAA